MSNRAGVVPLSVVSAKKPGEWIIRAMSPFGSPTMLINCVRQWVGVLDPDVEWTGYTYQGWPGYVVYDDAFPVKWPTGIYRFDHAGADCYRDAVRIGDVR